MRRNVASVAARIMAEEGIDDYGAAKRKAARQLHLDPTDVLPTNGEIEAALRSHQSLYQSTEQPQRLRSLRGCALRVMRLLEHFSPYLTGHVLDGTAGRYACIDLLLFSDAAKNVELLLLEHAIAYRLADCGLGESDGSAVCITLEFDGTPVRITVLAADKERLHQRNPHSGKARDRVSIGALESLLEIGA